MDNKQIIWIFRERRSGGTWFTLKLCHTLDRENFFIDDKIPTNCSYFEKEKIFLARHQQDGDEKKILNTHFFYGLPSIANYTNPILLRISRKDKTEQFLSEVIASRYNRLKSLYNLHDLNNLHKFKSIEPHKLDETLVFDFIEQSKTNEKLWYNYSKNFNNETIYYEDLITKFSSKILPIENWSMANNENNLTYKLPYEKEKIFLNYKRIKKIIEEKLITK